MSSLILGHQIDTQVVFGELSDKRIQEFKDFNWSLNTTVTYKTPQGAITVNVFVRISSINQQID